MKYHILHVFQVLLHVKKNTLIVFKDIHKLKALRIVDVNLTTSEGGVANIFFNFSTLFNSLLSHKTLAP